MYSRTRCPRRVRDKADLVATLVDEVYAGLDLVPHAWDHWTERLAGAGAAPEHLLTHPSVVPLALQQPGLGPHGLRFGEAIYNVLARPVSPTRLCGPSRR